MVEFSLNSPAPVPWMRRTRRVHLVGVGGVGMGGIAEVLNTLGFDVSGSDLGENAMTRRLAADGVRIFRGHSATHVHGVDVVVVSTAVPEDNPEVEAARAARVPVVPRAQMLAELMRFRAGIAVAGTHGKTTTTSLVASVLDEGGLDPTYVIGGRLRASGSNASLGEGRYLVAEADESDASFLHLKPVMAVVTNIDADHMETYGGDLDRLRQAFLDFLHHLPFYGLAVLCVDDPEVRDLVPRVMRPMLSYGFSEDAEVRALDVREDGMLSHVRVRLPGGGKPLQVQLNLPGRHNVMNALAAIAVARELQVDNAAIERGLANFAGIARRLESHGEHDCGSGRVTLVDDYAHHPRELEATLQATRQGWPGRRIVAVFQPHRYSRTRDLMDDFARVLSDLEVLVLSEVHAAGEAPITGADGRALARAIRSRGRVDPVFVESPDEVPAALEGLLREGDVVLVLGAGSIGTLPSQLVASWSPAVTLAAVPDAERDAGARQADGVAEQARGRSEVPAPRADASNDSKGPGSC